MAPFGEIAFTDEVVEGDHRYPTWITESGADVATAEFVPYYDRTAVFVLVRIGVETVSEYQTQYLRAAAIDALSRDSLPNLAASIVRTHYDPKIRPASVESEQTVDTGSSLSADDLEAIIAECQELVFDEIQSEIAGIRSKASRSADAELNEYRRLREQRLEELHKEITSIENRLVDIADEADRSESQRERVEALQRREELREKLIDLEAERDEIGKEAQAGYIEKRREIENRHAVEVRLWPMVSTLVRHDRGELEIKFSNGGLSSSMRVPYAVGEGVTEQVQCERCGRTLQRSNPIELISDGFACRMCSA